jgi:hypothetical protein
MSGRVVWFRDGKKVTGHRKTDRRRPPASSSPAAPHREPPWQLSFTAPATLGFLLGPTGLIGVSIGIGGHVTITGANLTWVYTQCLALFKRCAPGWHAPVFGRLTRSGEPGPAVSGPGRKPVDDQVELHFEGSVLLVRRGRSEHRIA